MTERHIISTQHTFLKKHTGQHKEDDIAINKGRSFRLIDIAGVWNNHAAVSIEINGRIDQFFIFNDHWQTHDLIEVDSTAVNWNDPESPVSQYFKVVEVTQGDPRRIPTDPDIQANILELAKELDEIRDAWGSAIGVNSWYRPPAVNSEVGGATNSQHLYGKAADIRPYEGSIRRFQDWLDNGLWKDRAMGYGAHKGFVHVDLRPGRIRWDY